jgi:hypothetical protein
MLPRRTEMWQCDSRPRSAEKRDHLSVNNTTSL